VRLAPRLALTFGLLAAVSTAGVGLAVRTLLADKETLRFQDDVKGVCDRLVDEIRRQGEADHTLIAGSCQSGELVERVGIAIDRGDLDERRTSFSELVRNQRRAFDLDELVLGIEGGDLVGASPTTLLGLPARDVDALLHGNAERFAVRTSGAPALVSRCTKKSDGGRIVGLFAARHVDPLLERLAKTLDVTVAPSWPRPLASVTPIEDDKRKGAKVPRPKGARAGASASAGARASAGASAGAAGAGAGAAGNGELARAPCKLTDDDGAVLAFDVLKSTKELDANLHEVDRSVGLYAAVAFLVAIVLARSLGRPLSVLATEAGKVAAGEARPLQARGSGEVQELATAFDRMIQDLAVTRRRLAAASRVAAWREVARRVAHEVKNPLAPIRAAVETLRRLRAREDPRFDEYFDEATRTVLDEVHRIANIVTEFTRFARLPQPRPTDLDVEEVSRHVVQIHKAAAGDISLVYTAQKRAPTLRADRDQVIQILTNLVQNAFDAVKDVPGAAVAISTDTDGHYVAFSVADNGPGIAPEIAARRVEPYATTKGANGTGLGLAIAQRIALEHNGELSYIGRSADGRGAVFRLLLPVEGPPPMSESPTSDNAASD
jgi:two-component system nitrogen regulation sensor histidine kinase NtrY